MKKTSDFNPNEVFSEIDQVQGGCEKKLLSLISSLENEKYQLKKEAVRYSLDLALLEKELLILKGKIRMMTFRNKALIFVIIVLIIILISQTCLKSYSDSFFQKIKQLFKNEK